MEIYLLTRTTQVLAIATLLCSTAFGGQETGASRTGSSNQAQSAMIEGVQMPAWLERDGVRQPIYAGLNLQARDQIVTGDNARVLLSLPEGSKVRLGERAHLGLDSLIARQQGKSVFLQSAMHVLTGAFRFTTGLLSKSNNQRDVSIRLATITAGIRGTDLWGKQGGDKEIVCLLEGKIEVARDAVAGQLTPTVTMDQPLQFYVAPKGQASLPIGRVPEVQLQQWAAETEIAADAGGSSVNGRWQLNFDDTTGFTEALDLHDTLRQRGYAAQFQPDRMGGERIYRVRLAQLSSEGDASALAIRLAAQGYGVARVSQAR